MHDTNILKTAFLLNGAGNDQYNPILSGLPIVLKVRFVASITGLSGRIGSEFPPTTPITFTVDGEDALLYTHTALAGTAPWTTGKKYVRLTFTDIATGKETTWDKQVYIAALPIDAVQVYDVVTRTWRSVNYETIPSIVPSVCQMCGIRFFNSWYDDFRIARYGGASHVSVYDVGTTETESTHTQVRRRTKDSISSVHYVYCEKHVSATEEYHDFLVTFRSEPTSSNVVNVRVRVKTLACYGMEIKDPETT